MRLKKSSLAIAAVAAAALLCAGCGQSNKGGDTAQGGTLEKTTPDSYPIETDATVDYYMGIYAALPSVAASMNETEFAKELIKETGINVNFVHPAPGDGGEALNLMIASNDLPDIVEADWYSYLGGAAESIRQKIILPLNDIMEVASPNLSKYYEEHPDIANMLRTDDGQYYMYPFVRGDELLMTFRGPFVRQDLLDKVGMSQPETIEDWDAMLRAFKDAGVKIPLTLRLDIWDLKADGNFMGAYGIAPGFYHQGNTVKYGFYEPAFRDYVEQLHTWYADGILDQEFTDTDAKRISSIMINGDAASTFGTAGGELGSYLASVNEKVPEAKFTAVPYPTQTRGEIPMFGQKDIPVNTTGSAITTQCENVEIAARMLDFGYTEAGRLLYNFGVEGESYTMENGEPTYTPAITDPNSNGGLSMAQAMSKYIRAHYNGPFIQDKGYIIQYYQRDEQKEALNVWANTATADYKMPLVALTAEENQEYSKILTEMETYVEEMLYKFVAGQESLDNFDAYYEELKNIGVERAIAIQQAAYDRYLQR